MLPSYWPITAIDGVQNGQLSAEEGRALDAERDVLEHLDTTAVRSLKIGFTATPTLAAKRVEQYFPHLIGRVYHADLVDAGYLVPYRIVQCDGTVREGEIDDLERLSQEQEAAILEREGIYGKLLGEYAEALATYRSHKERHSFPLRGMAFCTNHAECEKFSAEAKALGIRCEIVTGHEARGKAGRQLILEAKQRLVQGDIDLIVTVEKLCAGFNFPEVNAIVWARITSMAKTIQGVGRGSRSHAENGWRKEHCFVYETNWGLERNARRGRKPLRIADALAENGEDPKRICGMENGSKLEYEQPVTAEMLREALATQFTPEQWAGMRKEGKKQLKIKSLGLIAIARRFGIEGDPIGYHAVHLALGKAIWGEAWEE